MWRWLTHNHQTLTGIGAMLVGIAALFVAWDQGRVMRAQQHGAVVPVLQLDGFLMSRPETRSIGLRVYNNGVGPAMVESVSVRRDGVAMSDFSQLFEYVPDDQDRSWASLAGRTLAPGGMIEPIMVVWPRDALEGSDLGALLEEWARWEAEACYCSVFDRCWTTNTSNARPQPVRQCVAQQDDVFQTIGSAPEAQEPEQ
ncbi:MAG: hypothetical protein U9P68_00225 [Pseudomonadota bacterium]|nr:hypothetical protein [Pseudomonadota bacterium]